MVLSKIHGFVFLSLIIISCGGELPKNDDTVNVTEVASDNTSVSIKAEVCKKRIEEPQGISIQLFVRNLNDFTWSGVTLVGEDFSSQTYQIQLDNLTPESVQNTEPFTDSKDFKTRSGTSVKGTSREHYGRGLTTFSLLSKMSIVVTDPASKKWSGDVISCQ